MIITVADDLSAVEAVADDGSWMRLGSYNPETMTPWGSAGAAEAYALSCAGRMGYWQAADVHMFPTLDELKAKKRAAVSAILEAKLTGGYPHDFGAPHGIKVLQTRNVDDRTNWLVSQASYSAAVAGGVGAFLGANFRTEDNINIVLSYADGLNVLLAMASWGAAHYARSWELKDAITAAIDEAALDAIDIESGWPS